MAERKRCCCNCGNCRRVDKGTHKENYCVIDGHYIGYIETFEGWCRRWKKAHTLTEGARTMTDKKRLIELICNSHLPIMFADDTVGEYCIGQEDAERIADHLIANGVTVQEGKPLEAFLHPIDAYKGLKAKYLVFKADTGEKVDNCFILRPDKDPAAVEALRAYASATDNETLAENIYNWVGKGKPVREWIPASEPPEEHDSIWAKLYGTKSWQPGLFRKCSYDVLACVEKKDGSRRVISIRTYDGKWDNNKLNEETVICWQSMPQPPKGE